MDVHRGAISPKLLVRIIEAVAVAYDPFSNEIQLANAETIAEVNQLVNELTGKQLSYVKSYFFLACPTTMERVMTDPAEGWHADSSCAMFTHGTALNVWIPLYVRSSETGLRVIASADNPEFYIALGDRRRALRIVTRSASAEIFATPDSNRADFLFHRDGETESLFVEARDLVISEVSNPLPGDLAIFPQSDVHKGYLSDGVRLQLTIKFAENSAIMNADEAAKPPYRKSSLSKHGRMEETLVHELLHASALSLHETNGVISPSHQAGVLAERSAHQLT